MVSGLHYLDTLRCIDLQPGKPTVVRDGTWDLDFGFYLLSFQTARNKHGDMVMVRFFASQAYCRSVHFLLHPD